MLRLWLSLSCASRTFAGQEVAAVLPLLDRVDAGSGNAPQRDQPGQVGLASGRSAKPVASSCACWLAICTWASEIWRCSSCTRWLACGRGGVFAWAPAAAFCASAEAGAPTRRRAASRRLISICAKLSGAVQVANRLLFGREAAVERFDLVVQLELQDRDRAQPAGPSRPEPIRSPGTCPRPRRAGPGSRGSSCSARSTCFCSSFSASSGLLPTADTVTRSPDGSRSTDMPLEQLADGHPDARLRQRLLRQCPRCAPGSRTGTRSGRSCLPTRRC